jgi:hypothetical protein
VEASNGVREINCAGSHFTRPGRSLITVGRDLIHAKVTVIAVHENLTSHHLPLITIERALIAVAFTLTGPARDLIRAKVTLISLQLTLTRSNRHLIAARRQLRDDTEGGHDSRVARGEFDDVVRRRQRR